MEDLISNLIERLIIPHFGPLDYKVLPTWKENIKDGSRTIDGCLVSYFDVKYDILPSLLSETKLILRLVGYKKITDLGTNSNYLFVIGKEL